MASGQAGRGWSDRALAGVSHGMCAQVQGGICSEWEPVNKDEYRGVWVLMEVRDGSIVEASLQMLSVGRTLADKLGTYLAGVLVGHDVKKLAMEPIYHGADKVFVVDDPKLKTYYPRVYGRVVVELAKRYKPEIILIAATMRGREIAPYIAIAFKTGITADCTSFDIDPETRDLIQIRPPFGAWMLAHIRTPERRPQLATARPNVFDTPPRDETRKGEVIEVPLDFPLPDPGLELVEEKRIEKGEEIPLEKAEVVVAGGKGIGSAEGFKLLEELASLLGGVVAGSRKAVDAGWIPHEKQIGQTGKSVKPKVYFAIGISGTAQHVFGIREAKRVVAINIDPEAPIFQSADYGIVGDYREVVPALIEEIKKRKQKTRE